MRLPSEIFKVVILALLLSCIPLTLQAEGRRKIQIIPLPPASSAGSAVDEQGRNNFIFLDETAGELLLAYPPNLSYDNFDKAHSEERVVARIGLAIGVRPTVQTEVLLEPTGILRYDFRVGNEPSATQPIWRWVLHIPVVGEEIRPLRGPQGWDFANWERKSPAENTLSVMNLVEQDQLMTAADLVRKQMQWWIRTQQAEIEPGSCCESFLVETTWLPGIRTAYFQGSNSKVSVPGSVPKVLSYRLPAFNFIETNSVSMPIIGPTYKSSDFLDTRVCGIMKDVEILAAEQRIKSTPFVAEIMRWSSTCSKSDINEVSAAVEALKGIAKNTFEEEIAKALQINLDVR